MISNVPSFYLIGRYVGLFQYFTCLLMFLLLYLFLSSIWSSLSNLSFGVVALITFISSVYVLTTISLMVNYKREISIIDANFEETHIQNSEKFVNGSIWKRLKSCIDQIKLLNEKYLSMKTFGIYSKVILHIQEILEIIVQVIYIYTK